MRIEIGIEQRDVKELAGMLILSAYPIYKQLNILSDGGEGCATMGNYISAVRSASEELIAMGKIPPDYQSPKYWPTLEIK